MKNPKQTTGGNGGEDDAYVLDDTGDSTVEDIEHQMEVTAQEAADSTATRRAKAAQEGPAGEENRELQNRYLRTLADFENYRKRADREKGDFYKYALAGVLKDLLPVLENFDRSLEHGEEGDDFHKGVLLIYKQMWEVLQRHGLRAIDQAGVPFDPQLHEAVVREENPSVPSQTVTAILQKGYFLHDRLLRPALVKVAVGGPEHQG